MLIDAYRMKGHSELFDACGRMILRAEDDDEARLLAELLKAASLGELVDLLQRALLDEEGGG